MIIITIIERLSNFLSCRLFEIINPDMTINIYKQKYLYDYNFWTH